MLFLHYFNSGMQFKQLANHLITLFLFYFCTSGFLPLLKGCLFSHLDEMCPLNPGSVCEQLQRISVPRSDRHRRWEQEVKRAVLWNRPTSEHHAWGHVWTSWQLTGARWGLERVREKLQVNPLMSNQQLELTGGSD